MRLKLLAMFVPLALAACGEASTSARETTTEKGATVGVEVTDAWCRATPNGARTGACYGTLTAVGGDDRLVRIETSAAASAEVHDMSEQGGMMRMTPMTAGLALPKDQAVVLAPGGMHLMLTGLQSPLRPGEQAPMVLTFASGRRLELLLPVRMGAAR